MSRLVMSYKSLNKMTSLVKILPRKTALRKAASLRLSIHGDLNSSKSYLKNSVIRHLTYCPIDILNSAILLPLMAH